MKRLPTILLLAFLAALVAFGAFGAHARGEWFKYVPKGAVDGKGILQDVESRCDAAGRKRAYEPDRVTYCHELTHQLNSRIRQEVGDGHKNAFYVGQGKCIVLHEPDTTLSRVATFIRKYRNSTFDLYLKDQQKYFNKQPLYILDEWVAYTNGCQAAKELGIDEHGSNDRATWFCHYADALVECVQADEPNYDDLKKLVAFVDWHKKRVAEIVGEKQYGAAGDFMADIPPEWRERNRARSCAHMSTAHCLRYMQEFSEANSWLSRHRGGESPSPHRRKLEASGVKYAMTTDSDDELLEYCIANRLMMGITTKSKHCLNLVGRITDGAGNRFAVLLDNNRPSRYEYEPWDNWYRKYKRSGWAFTILSGEVPPPNPK